MSNRSFLRKSAASVAATVGLAGLGSAANAQIVLPPDFTIGIQTNNPGLLEGRLAGAFNTTDPNPGQVGAIGGPRLEPIMAHTSGGQNIEPWPDNVTYIYTGQMFFPDNGGGNSTFAMAEHNDDNTLIRVNGVQRLSNTQWDVPNTTGALSLPAGWHEIELRFGQGAGGAGPSDSGGWVANPAAGIAAGFGVDFTAPIDGAQPPTQTNFARPVDPGNSTVFRFFTYNTDTSRDGQSVTVNANGTLNVFQARTVPLGALTVSNGTTFTVNSPGGGTTFTEANIGSTATFAIASGTVSTGPLKSAGAVTTITKTGAGTLRVPTALGSNVTSNPTVNVNAGTLSVAIGATGASVGGGPINLSGSTLALANDLVAPTRAGVFGTTGQFYLNDSFNPFLTGIPDSTNTFGWSGLDSKTNLDSKLAPLTPIAVRDVNLEINFPRGNGSLVDGGTGDDPDLIFNTGGANLNVPLTGTNDSWAARFTGKLNVTSPGATEFLLMSNDGAAMFIDMDLGPGTNWQKVVDNNRYSNTGGGVFQGHYSGSSQGVSDQNLTVDPAAPAIANPAAPNLPAGVYDYIVGMFNANGDEAGVELFWTPSGGTRSIIPFAIQTGPVTLNNITTVSGASSLDVQAPSATMTDLRMNPGSSLAVRGNPLTTNITATGAGTVSIGTSGQPIRLTTLADGGNAVTFNANQGRVMLTRNGGPGPGFGATSNVGASGGATLVATGTSTENTLNAAPITLGGGTLELVSNPGIQLHHTSDSAFNGTFLEDTLEPGSTPGSNYIVFRGQTAPTFTLTSIPLVGAPARAPVNAIEIRRGTSAIGVKFAADQPNGAGGDGEAAVNGPAGVNSTATWNNFGVPNTPPEVPNQAVPQPLNIDVAGVSSPSTATVTWASNNIWSSTGRGEENHVDATSTGENRDLMSGYLDTGDINQTGVTINVAGLPASLTGGTGYDVYVYIKGGINGRGGDYRFGSSTAPAPNFGSNVNVTENSTINVTGFTGARVGNISVDAGRTLTTIGNRLTVGNVSAGTGGLVVLNSAQGSEVAGALGGDGTVRVPSARTVDFTSNGAVSTGTPKLDIVRGGTTRFTPGAAGTFAGAAVTSIANEGLLHATNGVTDLSGATMTTTNAPGLQAGLFGGRVANAANAVDFPNANSGTSGMDLALSRAQTTDNGFFGGDNGTWVYTGEIKIPDTDGDGTPGPIAFGEQFDDFTHLKIDGQVYLNNNSWNVAGSSGEIERLDNEPDGNGTAGDGWFSIEARFGQGGGGVGPNTGWTIGFGIDTNTADGFDAQSLPLDNPATAPSPVATATQYVAPVDDGTMNLFRAVNPAIENIRIDSGATLKLGAVVGANIITMAPTSRLELHGLTTSKISNTALTLPGTPTAPTATVDLTDSALVIDYPTTGPTATEVADVRSRIIAGRGGTGLGKTWNGQGITSSTAGAAAVNSMAVGYAVNGQLPLGAYTTFRGQSVDPSSILTRFTRTGDANLDGVVNNDDVTIVGANYAPGSAKPRWDLGDFDFNGFVDDDDVTLLGVYYNPAATPIPAPDGGVAAVPEPSTWLMLTIGGLGAGLAGWRRRRKA